MIAPLAAPYGALCWLAVSAAVDAMLTMEPRHRPGMHRRGVLADEEGPARVRRPASGSSAPAATRPIGPNSAWPAALSTQSIRPSSALAVSTARLDRRPRRRRRRPARWRRRARRPPRPPGRPRSTTATRPPPAANRRAVAAAIPEPPPVANSTLPSKLIPASRRRPGTGRVACGHPSQAYLSSSSVLGPVCRPAPSRHRSARLRPVTAPHRVKRLRPADDRRPRRRPAAALPGPRGRARGGPPAAAPHRPPHRLRPRRHGQSFLGLPAWQPGDVARRQARHRVPRPTRPPDPSRACRPSTSCSTVERRRARSRSSTAPSSPTGRRRADSALGSRLPLPVRQPTSCSMVGAGGLAPHLVAAHRAVRPSIERVLIWNRTRDASRLRSPLPSGPRSSTTSRRPCREADIVCTATMTKEALVEGRWLRPGTHLDLVGAYLPDHREVDDEAVVRAELYVDTREVTTVEDGDLVIPLAAGTDHPRRHPGRPLPALPRRGRGRSPTGHDHPVRERRRRPPGSDDRRAVVASVAGERMTTADAHPRFPHVFSPLAAPPPDAAGPDQRSARTRPTWPRRGSRATATSPTTGSGPSAAPG